MRFRFDEIEKEDLRAINGNLYLRHGNQWYLFVKSIKGYNFETEYGEGVFSVTDSNGTRHIFYTASGIYMRTENVEVVVGQYTNAEFNWKFETLSENSENAEKLFEEIASTLSDMNGEKDKLKSVNKYATRNEITFGLPDIVEEDDDEERLEYRC